MCNKQSDGGRNTPIDLKNEKTSLPYTYIHNWIRGYVYYQGIKVMKIILLPEYVIRGITQTLNTAFYNGWCSSKSDSFFVDEGEIEEEN